MQNLSNSLITFDTQFKTALWRNKNRNLADLMGTTKGNCIIENKYIRKGQDENSTLVCVPSLSTLPTGKPLSFTSEGRKVSDCQSLLEQRVCLLISCQTPFQVLVQRCGIVFPTVIVLYLNINLRISYRIDYWIL